MSAQRKNTPPAASPAGGVSQQAFTVDEFCQAHRICRASFYNLIKAGRGPRIMKPSGGAGRTLISVEAAAEWRAAMEEKTAGRPA